MTEHLRVDTDERIMSIRFNRADKKNALTQAMYAAAADALSNADQDDAVRVVLISGTNDCFTSGNDLSDFLNSPPAGDNSPVGRFLQAISTVRKPLVAAVEGIAVGIGTTMLLHCDLVYAGQSARLQLPFVNLALVPEAGSSYLLPALMGHQRAAELLMLGEMFDARKAVDYGIVNAICADGRTYEHAQAQARSLAAKPPAALRLTKELMKGKHRPAVVEQMQTEMQQFGQRLVSPEAREAMRAFMERRAPDFSTFD